MVKLIGLLKRKPGMSKQDFRSYYENSHAPLVQRILPAGDDYRRSYPNLVLIDGKEIEGEAPFDVIAEMWFEDQAAYERFAAAIQHPDTGALIAADEERFVDRSATQILFVEECRSPRL